MASKSLNANSISNLTAVSPSFQKKLWSNIQVNVNHIVKLKAIFITFILWINKSSVYIIGYPSGSQVTTKVQLQWDSTYIQPNELITFLIERQFSN